jgi:hypothetical protein
MAKYRKKPVVIEAVQWDGSKISEITDWVREAINKQPGTTGSIVKVGSTVNIGTLEGTTVASPGDFIIKGVNDEIYACKPEIFEKTYEHVLYEPTPVKGSI